MLLQAKGVVAAVAAWSLAKWLLPSTVTTFAPFTALLILRVTLHESIRDCVQYLVAMVLGTALAAGLGATVGVHAWSLAVLILCALAIGKAQRLGYQGTQLSVIGIFAFSAGHGSLAYIGHLVASVALGAACAQPRQRLGVLEYPELSISGPVAVSRSSGRLTMQGLGSLVTVPFSATPMTVSTTANELVVVENKEAAGYLARSLQGHAVVWSSGFNGAKLRQVLSELGPVCPRTWVVCHADTDGVHISNLVVGCVPHAIVVDVGSMSGAKPRRERGYAGTRTLRTIIDNPDMAPQVRRFAEQVDARGYEVEQEEFMPQVLGLITHR